jgi:diguanylate cyclase (GGDEF)-like protein
MGAVLLLDLDDFKGVNDTHGHTTGDQLLVSIAHRFVDITRASDTLGRFGGDEFLYLAEDLRSPDEAIEIAERMLRTLAPHFNVHGRNIGQRASVGIVIWDGSDTQCSEIIQNADVAMYEAKRQGKGHYAVFTREMRDQVSSHFELLQELRHALVSGELSMHYQPIVRLDNLDIVGFEALMRWEHPVRGMVSPCVFIPLAEQSDLILELGAFALEQAVTAASGWSACGDQPTPPYVSVNLSAHQFQDPVLASVIERVLKESGLPAQRLIIEITESVTLLDVIETSSVVQRLNSLGVDFALDDFGTGYSSLSYLADLSPEIIKIDQSFVNPAIESDRNDALLEAIISLGHKLEGTMLGEGIETPQQLQRLRELQCELGQGFHFSPAIRAHDVPHLISRVPWKKRHSRSRHRVS